jgi:hypothetical protein
LAVHARPVNIESAILITVKMRLAVDVPIGVSAWAICCAYA